MKVKELFKLLVLSIFAGTCSIAWAGNLNIGVIDTNLIFEQSSQAKAAQTRIEKEFKPRQEKLVAREKSLQEKMNNFERDKEVLSEKDRLAQSRDISRLQQEYQRLAQELNYDAQVKQREEVEKFQSLVSNAVNKVAKDGKYDLILPSHMLAYSSDAINITDKVIKALEG